MVIFTIMLLKTQKKFLYNPTKKICSNIYWVFNIFAQKKLNGKKNLIQKKTFKK